MKSQGGIIPVPDEGTEIFGMEAAKGRNVMISSGLTLHSTMMKSRKEIAHVPLVLHMRRKSGAIGG